MGKKASGIPVTPNVATEVTQDILQSAVIREITRSTEGVRFTG